MSSYSTGQGFCNALLIHMEALAKQAYGAFKLDRFGSIECLTAPSNQSAISIVNESITGNSGHIRALDYWYRRRNTIDEVRDSPECTYDADEGRLEGTINIDQYAELGFSMSEETIAQYCVDASRVENWLNSGAPGQPPITGKMNEVMQVVMGTMNAMLASVEINAANFIASSFGNNLGNSPSSPTAISLPFLYSATNLPVYKGMSDLRHQFTFLNNQEGLPQIVGGGIFDKYNASNPFFGLNLGGIDMGKTVTPKQYDYYPSNYAPTEFGGDNNFAVLAPNSAMMFNRTRNKGAFGGLKADGSYYGYFPAPLQSGNKMFDFDIVFQGNYCGNASREIQILLSFDYGFWAIPNDAYKSADRLSGVTGVFEYVATAI